MELSVFFGVYTSTSSKGVHFAQLLVVVAVLAIGSAVALSQTTSANPEESILKLTFKQILPKVKLIYLTMNLDPDLAAEPFRLGASGYIVKNSAATELVYGIRGVLRGRSYITSLMTREMVGSFLQNIERKKNPNQLTLRQKKVFQLLAEGRSMKEAAFILDVTPRTVAFHKYTMMEHLQLRSSAELFQFCGQNVDSG